MKTWIYSWIAYPLLYALAVVFGFFNRKARDTLRLRSWKHFLGLRFDAGEPIEYWLHVASAGELEYAIPILAELGRMGKRVLITYYSISAKNPVDALRDNFKNVSLVVPLPHDGLGLMKEFVQLVKRQGVRYLLLLKYELWPGLLWECNSQGVQVLLVDALKPGWFHKRLLHKLDGILSGYDSEVREVIHPRVKVVGDTRVERVLQRMGVARERVEKIVSPALREALGRRETLVCGSMWPPDSALVLDALSATQSVDEKYNVIWVPHELNEEEGRKVAKRFRALGYSVCTLDQADSLPEGPVAVIVMKKGVLAELYGLGTQAYVGGGFGDGVHSVWEPALYGIRVACGPDIGRSPEARELQQRGWLATVAQPAEYLNWIRSGRAAKESGRHGGWDDLAAHPLADLMQQHIGAAKRIIEYCEKNGRQDSLHALK